MVSGRRYAPGRVYREGDELIGIVVLEFAVATGTVVVLLAIAIVLVVLFVALSMRGGQQRSADRRGEVRDPADVAAERAERQRDRDIARGEREQAGRDQ